VNEEQRERVRLAAERLLVRQEAWVRSQVWSAGGPPIEAASVVLSVYASLCRLSELPDGDERLDRFIWVMTRYKFLNRFRHESIRKRNAVSFEDAGEPAHADWGPEEEARWRECEEIYDRCLRSLSQEQRQALQMTDEGMEQAEIAHRLGMAERSLRRCLKNARERLKQLLDQHFPRETGV
jgi:RNA polymerase sigma factor (sigma-70 family)